MQFVCFLAVIKQLFFYLTKGQITRNNTNPREFNLAITTADDRANNRMDFFDGN